MTANVDAELSYAGCEDRLKALLKRRWFGRVRDAELRKLICRIYAGVDQARRLDAAGRITGQDRTRLGQLLAEDLERLELDRALELADRWDRFLIAHGDAGYLCTLLEVEYARAEAGTTAVTWKSLYGAQRIPISEKFRAGEAIADAELAQARNRLDALYRSRVVLYSLHRARLVMKSHLLVALSPLLLALLGSLVVAADSQPGARLSQLVVAGLAGGVGATLSGTFKLRDHITHINDLRAFWPALFVQPLLGAAAGLFVLLVLESRLLEVGASGSDWAIVGAVAFAAGFSEPFLLGLVQRVAGIAAVEGGTATGCTPIVQAEDSVPR